jgi:superfamily II DNA/RNA helicase
METTFSALGLDPRLIVALEKQRISTPTPIQSLALPAIAASESVYLHSETGSGKTLAYLLPLFARINPTQPGPQVLVLAPTHELAVQIQKQATDLSNASGLGVKTLLLIGGTSLDRQLEKLKKKPHLLVGSPGRIQDLIRSGKLKPQSIRAVVLDEADTLLGSESHETLLRILKSMPPERQLVFVSATTQSACTDSVQQLAPACRFLEPEPAPINPLIQHQFLVCEERDKPDVLRKLIHAAQPERALVFVHRHSTAEEVAAKLSHHHVQAADLHGAFRKDDRKKAMEDFRAGRTRILIASDLAARGIDIQGVSHVFNLDAPSQSKAYLHRTGRTARAGASGTAISILTAPETRLVRRYAQELGIQLEEVRLRNGQIQPISENPAGH